MPMYRPRFLLHAATIACALTAGISQAQTAFPATLAGHAVLPAQSFIEAPAAVPADLINAGKHTTGRRIEAPGSIEGQSAGRPTGVALPFKGQPLQGHSGIKRMPDGTFWLLTDNGAGSKANSPDFMLYLNRYQVDFGKGTFKRLETVFLHDPDKKIPFRIVHEGSKKRYLTGADFDPESFQFAGGALWIGDEFGPYVLRVDAQGKVLEVIDTVVAGKPYRGPDHYLQSRLPNYPADAGFEVRRSGGFEPMGRSPDGKTLYPMFEWPLWDAQAKAPESHKGKPFTRILSLDVASRQYGTQQWKYAFEEAGNLAADFQMLDATTGLVIERDDTTEGAGQVCPDAPRTDCFTRPARFKRIYKIDFSQADADGFVKKVAYIDLGKISNPARKARIGPNTEDFALPHLGPEGLAVVDAEHIVLVNDNNFPFSSGRTLGQPDANELTLLNIRALLDAR